MEEDLEVIHRREEAAEDVRVTAKISSDKAAETMIRHHLKKKPAAEYEEGEAVFVKPENAGERLKRSRKLSTPKAIPARIVSKKVRIITI